MKLAIGIASLLCASLALATPADLGRAVSDAANRKADLSAPVAKAFDEDLKDLDKEADVLDCLFANASAVGAVLPSLSGDQVKDAVVAVMKAAETCAKAIGALPSAKDLDAADTLGKCYATAIAALMNVIDDDEIRKDALAAALAAVPEAYAEQVTAAANDPAGFLGRVKANEGVAIAKEVNDAVKAADVAAQSGAAMTATSTTTTTTTTSTTSTTQVVIKLQDTVVDPVTLDPIGKQTVATTRPPKKTVVPPTRPSPTPQGQR